jgi:hypothetical protein
MRTLARQFLVAFLAAWLPFCCCQVRAAAAVVAHAGHRMAETDVPSCCQERTSDDCCAPAGCCDAAPDADRHDHEGKAPAKGDCCVSCKERALPAAAPTIDVDTVGTVDFVAQAVLATDALPVRGACAVPGAAAHDTGPPGAPGGRTALAMHSVLVI